MRRFRILGLSLGILLLAVLDARAAEPPKAVHHFEIKDGQFQLDGKPFQIISGEMHYARIPRAYWRDRLRMARAMGLNTITTYAFWNIHEPEPGHYDFSGNNNVAEFIREAQQEGLYVILRPGPYVCSEWDLGGLPSWLLKDKNTVIRSKDPKFMAATRRWLARLGKELAPLQLANGGPILAVQVENEYGAFGDDHEYMRQIRQADIDAGFGRSLLYTANQPKDLEAGSLPDTLSTINFGQGNAQKDFAMLRRFRPQGPYMVGEYWGGWIDSWGKKFVTTDAHKQADEIEWMLKQGYSISLYMFHGGTNFGWMNGADGTREHTYNPYITSYDYNAALNESGQPTEKYTLFRDAIARATGKTPPPVPPAPVLHTLPEIRFSSAASLWENLPVPVKSEQPLTMEDINQSYGYILYRKHLDHPMNGTLSFDAVHDYAQVYLDGKLIGSLDRRLNQNELKIDSSSSSAQLDILVENTGRVNYGVLFRGERAGIVGNVTFNGLPLTDWSNYALPMMAPQKMTFSSAPCTGACFYRATLHIDKPVDTYLDTSEFHKGQVWINGRPLGRIWYIGPQHALYLPGAFLHAGDNDVVIFDLEGAPGRSIRGIDHPVLGETEPAPDVD